MEPRVILTEIKVVQPQGQQLFYIQTKLINDGKEGFCLTLSNGINVWEGSVTEDMLDQLSSKTKMEFHDFVSQTKAAFTKEDMADFTFEYHLSSQTTDTDQFVWKKHIIDDDIKFQLGSIKLNRLKEPGPGICKLLSSSISNIKSLSSNIAGLQTNNQRLSSERNNALKRLEKCVLAKEEMELDLYSKFVAVLNSKKQKIQHLLENEESRTFDGSPPDSPVASTSKVEPSKTKHTDVLRPEQFKKRPNSCSDDNTGTDTDSEVSQSKRPRQSAPRKIDNDSLKDTSLNLGDDTADDEKLISSVARRPRRQAKNKMQTPSKPVLPRVSSGTSCSRPSSVGRRASNAGRKPSLNKSGSEHSNRSSDHLDPDDLLNNL